MHGFLVLFMINNLLRKSTTLSSRLFMSTSASLVVDPFCYRQFGGDYGGTVFKNISIKDFETAVNANFDENKLKPGYAPFCKHYFVKNDIDDTLKLNVLKITPENEHLLRTKYEARNDKEVPVLTRYFDATIMDDSNTNFPTATVLDLILYSREQINKENEAQGREANPTDASWGIVSIKAQDVEYELPMNPITIMRNSLGKAEGGSGVPLDREKYMESVNYWKDHAVVS